MAPTPPSTRCNIVVAYPHGASEEMRAVVFRAYGPPGVLDLTSLPIPEPGPGEVRIRVRACAVNHLDLDLRAGKARMPITLPHVLGREAAGTVDAIGPGVSGVAPGERVLAAPIVPCGRCNACQAGDDNLCPHAQMPGIQMPGGYAEYLVFPARGLLRLPAALSFEAAAATPISFGTAWRMLVTIAAVRPGETVLVTGAGGGLGSAAVQVAALRGAQIIAAAGSDQKLDYARACGAFAGINYRETDLAVEVLRLTGGRGVDVAVEHIGGDILRATLACMATKGRLITGGGHGGEVVPLDVIPFFRKELSLLGSRSQRREELETVLRLAGEGALVPHIDRVLPLEAAAEAHALLEARSVIGKVVLIP